MKLASALNMKASCWNGSIQEKENQNNMRKVVLEQPETALVIESYLSGKAVVVAVSIFDNKVKGVLIRSASGWQIASTHSVRLSDRFYETRAELMKAEPNYEFFTP